MTIANAVKLIIQVNLYAGYGNLLKLSTRIIQNILAVKRDICDSFQQWIKKNLKWNVKKKNRNMYKTSQKGEETKNKQVDVYALPCFLDNLECKSLYSVLSMFLK